MVNDLIPNYPFNDLNNIDYQMSLYICKHFILAKKTISAKSATHSMTLEWLKDIKEEW